MLCHSVNIYATVFSLGYIKGLCLNELIGWILFGVLRRCSQLPVHNPMLNKRRINTIITIICISVSFYNVHCSNIVVTLCWSEQVHYIILYFISILSKPVTYSGNSVFLFFFKYAWSLLTFSKTWMSDDHFI